MEGMERRGEFFLLPPHAATKVQDCSMHWFGKTATEKFLVLAAI